MTCSSNTRNACRNKILMQNFTHKMATNSNSNSSSSSSSSSQSCENVCREIQDSLGRLNDPGLALAHRTRHERLQIRETYMVMYGEDLITRLKKAEAANPKNEIFALLPLWMLEPHERDAVLARNALEGGDIKYMALVEIYAGRKSSQLLLIKQAYQAMFKRHLDQDINSETPTPYQRILVALATSHKSHQTDISQHVGKCDAKRLYEAGEGRVGAIDESVILAIFSKRSIPQLKLTFSSYKHIYGHDYTKSLKKENSGEFEDSLRAVVKCMYTPAKYYSKDCHVIHFRCCMRASRGQQRTRVPWHV
ncbi:annexin Gh1-like isoform X2 [Tasmannia lanceolata]|uniref:annexin Gh1-like isoform X2 n=1 Tax=Tasmannia lanceolata TaxID=3420 RepID=UPI0040643A35